MSTRPEPGMPTPWSIEALLPQITGHICAATGREHVTLATDAEQYLRPLVYAANKLPELEADRARLVAVLGRVKVELEVQSTFVEEMGDTGTAAEAVTLVTEGLQSDLIALLAELEEGTDD